MSIRPTASSYLPKKKASGVNYTHMGLIQAIGEGKIEGLWIWGQNPAAGGPTSLGARDALKKLKWMVASDIWFNETHTFWKRPESQSRRHPDRGIPSAGSRLLRKRGQHIQQRPLGAVALQSGGTSRRGHTRPGHDDPALQEDTETV